VPAPLDLNSIEHVAVQHTMTAVPRATGHKHSAHCCSSLCSCLTCHMCDTRDPPQQEENSQFKEKKRRCTDRLFFILFVAFWVGNIAILVGALADGAKPRRILNGVNYQGDICGRGGYAYVARIQPN
jgi:hypothetical protein